MPVAELRVADVGVTILVHGVPAVTELTFNHDYQRCLHYILFMFLLKQAHLTLPAEGELGLNLLSDHLADHVPAVHVDSADGHHLLAVPLGQVPQQQGDQVVQLTNLLLVVVLQGVFIPAVATLYSTVYLISEVLSYPSSSLLKAELTSEVQNTCVPARATCAG